MSSTTLTLVSGVALLVVIVLVAWSARRRSRDDGTDHKHHGCC